ncbi:MAG: cytidylate kinase [Pseudomonadota bacterium]
MTVIAIDGPAASGKGTLARMIAAHFGFEVLDTGLLYRAVARDMLVHGHDLGDAACAAGVAGALDVGSLDDPDLRGPRVGEAASIVAAFGEVRRTLLEFQRSFARRPPGAVLDGRDIGTVVCPDADVKLFITASLEVRAERRFLELRERGEDLPFAQVVEQIRQRDARDSGRKDAPMRMAEDALLLDTTELDIDAAFRAAVGLIKRKIGQSGDL